MPTAPGLPGLENTRSVTVVVAEPLTRVGGGAEPATRSVSELCRDFERAARQRRRGRVVLPPEEIEAPVNEIVVHERGRVGAICDGCGVVDGIDDPLGSEVGPWVCVSPGTRPKDDERSRPCHCGATD